MSRVWRYFFKSLVWPFGIAAYSIAVAMGATYADTLVDGGGLGVVTIFIVLPFLVYLIREMWQDARQKVEREDQEMMLILSHDDRSDLYEN